MRAGRAKVAVALSGGVDSSVAAALLLEQGYEVLGLTARLGQGATSDGAAGCSGEAVEAAAATARQLGIPLKVVDCRELFSERVLRPCWEAYAAGTTPNPCVLCNARIKFGQLLEVAGAEGASWLATGHYARLQQRADETPLLLRGRDRGKDQSYFLFSLSGQQLARTLLPLGDKSKQQVRQLARALELTAAARPESQDACFGLDQGGFAEALRLRFGAAARAGQVVNVAGQLLGEHRGIHRYTIGQRKGLEIALGDRAYVVALDAAAGQVVLSSSAADLLTVELQVRQVSWLIPPPTQEISAQVQIRYRHQAAPARILPRRPDRAAVVFAEAQRAVTPGQAAVFYRGDQVIGGGWIS